MEGSFSYRKYAGKDLMGNPVWTEVEASPEMLANIRRTRAEEEEIARIQDQYAVPARPDDITNERFLYSLDQYGRLMNRIYQGNLYGIPADVLERAYGRAYNPIIDVMNRTTSENDRLLYNTILRNERLVNMMPELSQRTEGLPRELRTNIANMVIPRISPEQYETLFNQEYDPRIDIRNPIPTRPNTPR